MRPWGIPTATGLGIDYNVEWPLCGLLNVIVIVIVNRLFLAPRSIELFPDMAESVEAQNESQSKEVLVVFWDKRRPIKFNVSEDPSEDKSNLIHAVQVAFSDIFPSLAADEGASSVPSIQTESKEWGGLMDVTGEVQDRSTIFIKQPENFTLQGVQILDENHVLLGNSAFTDVREVQYNGLKCAGRKINLRNHYAEKQAGVNPFQKECEFLSRIRHPNIVQFLGVFFQEGKPAPILVMEFLPTNLTSCIEQYGILPKEISYSILYDVALGLCYLHSQTPPIVHRDLSSNNILLTPNMTAKISDLAKAKILLENVSTGRSRMTTNPGNIDFMPPEAFMANPVYNTGIDEFSYGIMMIHVFSGKWPAPQIGQTRIEKIEGENKPVPVTEAERRKEFLDDIGKDHPLMKLILKCINNDSLSRAHASEIVERLAEMVKEFPAFFANRLDMLKRITADEEKINTLKEEHSPAMEGLQSQIRLLKAEVEELKSKAPQGLDCNGMSARTAQLGKETKGYSANKSLVRVWG